MFELFSKSEKWSNYSRIERQMLLQVTFQIGNLALRADGGYCANAQDNSNRDWEHTKSYLKKTAKEMDIIPEHNDTTVYTDEQREKAFTNIGQHKAIQYITEIKMNLIDTCSSYPIAQQARKDFLVSVANWMNCPINID